MGAAVLDLSDLDRQAKRILDDAREKASRIMQQAQQEAEQLIANADAIGHQQGLERGMAEGREQGRREGHEQVIAELKPRIESLMRSWMDALQQWEAERTEMILSAREDALAFAVAMGEKVIFRTVQVDGTIIEDQLAEALSLLSQPSRVAVTINPRDRALAEEVLPELLRSLGESSHATIRDDPSVTPGGCVLRTAGGEVDATLETQLDRIVHAILPWLSQEQVPHTPNEQEADS